MSNNRNECLLISDFTASSLAGLMENSSAAPECHVATAPFDQVAQVLLQADHESWAGRPQSVVLWTRPERVSPSFAKSLAGELISEQQVLAEVDALCDLIAGIQERISYCFIPTWVFTLPKRGLGVMDLKQDVGCAYLLSRMNTQLIQRFSTSRVCHVLDTNRWLQEAGKWAYSPRGWYLAKNPFGNEVFSQAAKDIKAALRALGGKTKKLVVVDLDGTLWGGILGDLGWENLGIGGHDAIGEAFADFQRELKALRQRGILLAISSKNEEPAALEAITRHPEMVLKKEDFVAWRINWNDKAANIADMVAELNLGLDSVVFLDDNPVERSRVGEALPQILVPDLPDDKMLLASFLRKLDCFDPGFISETDRARTQLYQTEQQREALRGATQSIDEWLGKLATRVTIEPLNGQNRDRALQLLNKTNQMNLSTRRLSEAELQAWLGSTQNHFWTLRVVDRFGDSGLVGLMSLSAENDRGQILDFILSCRVMGRRIEAAMLHHLLMQAKALGLSFVEADYVPTIKNGPCLKFFESSGAERNGNLFRWDTKQDYHPPQHVAVELSQA
jgi:FkbH-like protein